MPAPIFPALLMYGIIHMALTYGTHRHIWLDGTCLCVCLSVCVYTRMHVESEEDGERGMKLI